MTSDDTAFPAWYSASRDFDRVGQAAIVFCPMPVLRAFFGRLCGPREIGLLSHRPRPAYRAFPARAAAELELACWAAFTASAPISQSIFRASRQDTRPGSAENSASSGWSRTAFRQCSSGLGIMALRDQGFGQIGVGLGVLGPDPCRACRYCATA